ncbi:ABC transporter substrate-binding protein [Kribbella albertanoniae]|uniref:ABC transporter substrate-binding protein n=1 Tax=Kribbella albertanoniae TaxID=1266829 RepID=A0A4V2XNC5_9ACTN|nr:ABC transporter substrate-binding protein [Kribbella albertanoniae]TDC17656.1 ABC transporter substrate-binding protein [Kribbella albertanoniae]
MSRKRITTAVAVAAAVALSLAACGGPKATPGGGSSAGGATAEANAAVDKNFSPSTKKGGTLRMAISEAYDSTDPGDTYYGLSWNLVRTYVRPLMTFKATPGEEGGKPVPDLAEAPGVPSDGAKTWTYKIRKGIKFEDGTPVTSKDVKYGVARSLDKATLPSGPTYFNDFLLDVPEGFSVYKDKTLAGVAKAIETPDDQTIVFHLKKPFSSFDYFAQLPSTAPVPQAKDTGAKYKEHPMATGPYKFGSYDPNKGFDLVRNENYDASTDPDSGRNALPDKYTIAYNVEGTDIDNRLIAGDLDVDLAGTGVQPETQAKVLADPKLKAHTDNVPAPRLNFTVLNTEVPPLDNVHCRKAILYAADHEGYQRAYGGPIGGDIATNLMPPSVLGSQKFDDYGFEADKNGNVEKAKDELKQCGQPNGFAINIAFRGDRNKEKAVAETLQQSLKKAGITLTTKPYPTSDYTKLYAGKPDFAKTNKLGLIVYSWGADWNDGFGFLQQIVDSRTIRATGGNTNLGVRIPEVDQLIDKAMAETDETKRNQYWVDVDKKVMEQAGVLPGIWAKGLLYRPDTVANVFTNAGQNMYDYAGIGLK